MTIIPTAPPSRRSSPIPDVDPLGELRQLINWCAHHNVPGEITARMGQALDDLADADDDRIDDLREKVTDIQIILDEVKDALTAWKGRP
jgi:hypothetical protein